MASSFSVPRPRRRRSSSAIDGGAMNTYTASRSLFFTSSAPWTSMSRTHTRPAFDTASTAANDVP
eukprot:31131-Pelagococcus_subviridis.AAC.2